MTDRNTTLADMLARPSGPVTPQRDPGIMARLLGQASPIDGAPMYQGGPQMTNAMPDGNFAPAPQGLAAYGERALNPQTPDERMATNVVRGMTENPATSGVTGLRQALAEKYPGTKVWVEPTSTGHLRLSQIVVAPEQRGKGIGSSVMQDITNFADTNGMPMALSPDAAFGGSVPRLREFYSRFGFSPNKGRSRDPSVSETMIRPPTVKP